MNDLNPSFTRVNYFVKTVNAKRQITRTTQAFNYNFCSNKNYYDFFFYLEKYLLGFVSFVNDFILESLDQVRELLNKSLKLDPTQMSQNYTHKILDFH